MKTVALVLGMLALAACSDDSKAPTNKDKGVVIKLDGQTTNQDNGGVLPDNGTTQKDTGGTVGKEAGGASNLGAKCNQSKPCTGTAICAQLQGWTDGFCTQECPVADFGGKPCTGGPSGTGYFCVLGDKLPTPTKAMCAFICKAKDQAGSVVSFPCPTELKCGTPDANGNAMCEP